MARVTVKPVTGHKYKLEIDSGTHIIICDQPTAVGGSGSGPGPKELQAGALGACAAQTILMMAPSRKWDIKELSVTVTISKQGDNDVITEEIEVKGNLTQQELDSIKRMGERCPVMKLFTGTKTVTATIKKKP
ncbi:MAG: OsmC family protein [Candidatus Obscuribacterales bacterium]|nr:OsmC family protein [Candidatus Obscuribacterales bacterium]